MTNLESSEIRIDPPTTTTSSIHQSTLKVERSLTNTTSSSVTQDPLEKPIDTESLNKRKKRSFMDHPVFPGTLLVLAGIAIAFQAGCNATLNHYGGRSFSSVVTFTVGALCCVLFFIFDILVLKTPVPDQKLKGAPWYAWMGGVLGAYYVITNILTVPRLGTATVLSIFVCAQIIMACIIDHFALVGVTKRKITKWRILGSLGLIACVVVIAKF